MKGLGCTKRRLASAIFQAGEEYERGRVLVESEIIESLYFENAVKQCETMKHIYIIYINVMINNNIFKICLNCVADLIYLITCSACFAYTYAGLCILWNPCRCVCVCICCVSVSCLDFSSNSEDLSQVVYLYHFFLCPKPEAAGYGRMLLCFYGFLMVSSLW